MKAVSAALGFVAKHAKLLWGIAGVVVTVVGFLIAFAALPAQVKANTVNLNNMDRRLLTIEAREERRDIFLCTLLEANPATHRNECTRILSIDGK